MLSCQKEINELLCFFCTAKCASARMQICWEGVQGNGIDLKVEAQRVWARARLAHDNPLWNVRNRRRQIDQNLSQNGGLRVWESDQRTIDRRRSAISGNGRD